MLSSADEVIRLAAGTTRGDSTNSYPIAYPSTNQATDETRAEPKRNEKPFIFVLRYRCGGAAGVIELQGRG